MKDQVKTDRLREAFRRTADQNFNDMTELIKDIKQYARLFRLCKITMKNQDGAKVENASELLNELVNRIIVVDELAWVIHRQLEDQE